MFHPLLQNFDSFLFCVSASKDAIIALCLHAVIQPVTTIKVSGSDKKKKNIWRPSIAASQDSFFCQINTINDLDRKVQQKNDQSAKLGLSQQPYVIGVGEISAIETYYVIIDEIRYKFDNFVKALDICFKSHYVLNIDYSKESQLIWLFIQIYFFNIRHANDKTSTSLISLIAELNN